MSTSIAEIIGWPTVGPKRIVGRRIVSAPAVDPYKVDDLLAWIAQHVGDYVQMDVEFNESYAITRWPFEDIESTEGPTLLAALEAVVRALSA